MDNGLHELHAEIITCRACPRLVAWREEVARTKRRAYQDWEYWGKPVPGFGDPEARLLLIGLAPGAHGANRTGRAFTGDGSGAFLYAALHRAGFANQAASQHRQDGLRLTDCFITMPLRCAPPQNRPTTQELDTCRPFMAREIDLLPRVEVVLCLGQIALAQYLRRLREAGHETPRATFGHGAQLSLGDGLPHLLCSYPPSLQNTNPGRLTPAMMDDVLAQAKALFRSTSA